jgi:hypothetical protein
MVASAGKRSIYLETSPPLGDESENSAAHLSENRHFWSF